MPGFIDYCTQRTKLDENAISDLSAAIHTKSFQKRGQLLQEERVCRTLFFIDEGLTKTSSMKDGKEFIMRFFPEGEMFTVLDSYLSDKPSNFIVTALEPTVVTYIYKQEMEILCQKHHCIEHFFRKLLSYATLNMMKRINEMLEDDATQRYENFVRENPRLMQRISLGDLASYLGITQVSLSRIRGRS